MAPRKPAAKADPFAETKDETKNVTETAENTNEISVTLKGGAGYDAPWVVIRGSDASELTELLSTDELRDLLDKTADRGAYFAAKGGSGGGGGNTRRGSGSGPKEHPRGKTMSCPHGRSEEPHV